MKSLLKKGQGLVFFLLHPCPISSCCKERIPNGFALDCCDYQTNFLATNKTSQISNVKVVCVGILKIDKVLRSSVTSEATEDRIDRVGKILKKLCFGFVAAFREEASRLLYLSLVFRCGHGQKIGKSWSRA